MATPDEQLAYARSRAKQLGLGEMGARVVEAIMLAEGGMTGAIGDAGTSFGPFQFHKGGVLDSWAVHLGLDPVSQWFEAGMRAINEPYRAIDYALNGYLGNAIRAGIAQGYRGAALARYVAEVGQRTAHPDRVADIYSRLESDNVAPAPIDKIAPAPSPTPTPIPGTVGLGPVQTIVDAANNIARAIADTPGNLYKPFAETLDSLNRFVAWIGDPTIWTRVLMVIIGLILVAVGTVLFGLSFLDLGVVRRVIGV